MKILTGNIPAISFLLAAIFLLTHGHPVAGGWLIAAAILTAVTHK